MCSTVERPTVEDQLQNKYAALSAAKKPRRGSIIRCARIRILVKFAFDRIINDGVSTRQRKARGP